MCVVCPLDKLHTSVPYTNDAYEKDDARIEFSLRQAITYCMDLDLQLPDLSDDARLHSPLYDAWK